MTRFARAKGSKASNEKLPEPSTPWSVMKQDLQNAQLEAKTKSKRNEINQERQKNYDKFVEETEAKIEKKWAPFPKPNLKTIKKKKHKNKNLLKITESDVTDAMIDELCHPDPEVDKQLENMSAKIEKTLAKYEGKRKQNKKQKEKQIVNKEIKKENGDSNENDAPEEVSTKIETPKVVIKKAKNKKQLLKIPSIVQESKQNNPKEHNGEFVKNKKNNQQNKFKDEGKFVKNNQQNKFKAEGKFVKNNQQKDGKFVKLNANKQQKDGKFVKTNANNHQKNEKQQGQKRKLPKERDNKEHKRRKPDNENGTVKINGVLQNVVRYQGFPILESDCERIVELRKSLISKGIPHSEVNKTIKLERRKAEKILSRAIKVVCFHCRASGHLLSECPELKGNSNALVEDSSTGHCFKCGSTEHTYRECKVNSDFKFARCFICRTQGHISSQCPDNPRGLYPKGGACHLCGDVTHLKKDCPKHVQQQQDNQIFLNKISDGNIESIEADHEKPEQNNQFIKSKKKVVKF